MLCRLGFGLASGFEIRDQRQVNVQAILLADVEGKLPNRFEKGEPFNISYRAADFCDDDIDVVADELADGSFDLVGNVRDDLHRFPQVFPAPFLLDHGLIDLAGSVIAVPSQWGIGEALVVAQVEIGFGAVIQDIDFTVLIRAHRPGIDIDVGVELLQANS